MVKLWLFVVCLIFCPADSYAKAVRLGASGANNRNVNQKSVSSKPAVPEISCFENQNCNADQECVALRCVSVCTKDTCLAGKYCVPAGEENPHTYKCVECVRNFHCPDGFVCGPGYTCQKRDVCEGAVCSPAAPFCLPEPYETLPYTCVQCLDDSHCPPVAGLTRRCEKGYCLFNVEGNGPVKAQPSKAGAETPAVVPSVPPEQTADEFGDEDEEDEYYEEEEYSQDVYEDDGYTY